MFVGYLRQSTAATLKIGPFVDAADGFTAETGLTIAQADVRLSKNGGNYVQKTDATSATHDELGEYDCPIDVTDTDTPGRLRLIVGAAGARPVVQDYQVLEETVYDQLLASAATGAPTANQNADALLDRADGIETGVTFRQSQRLCVSAAAGKLNGAQTATVNLRDLADTKNRITATVDSSGNRTAITRDLT